MHRVNAIDATRPYTFLFVWNGLPIVGCKLTLKNITTKTNDIIIEKVGYLSSIDYDPTINTAIENGCTYEARVQVRYSATSSISNAATSEISDPIQFKTFATPSVKISGFLFC